jgi:hypothetical protein
MSRLIVQKQTIIWAIKGNTYPLKETIKKLGGTWLPLNKTWAIPISVDIEPLYEAERQLLAEEEAARQRALQIAAQAPVIRPARPSGRRIAGRCCAKAEFFEDRPFGPINYRCPDHGRTYNNYTGD